MTIPGLVYSLKNKLPSLRSVAKTGALWKQFFLASITLTLIAELGGVGIINPVQIYSQLSAANGRQVLSFEVATINPSHSSEALGQVGSSLGRFRCRGMTVKMLIEIALNSRTYGGPGWIESARYDIDAKAEYSVIEKLKNLPRVQQQEQNRLMLQSLLASRFNLQLKHERKVAPVYRLVVAKNGSKLRQTNGVTSGPPFELSNGKLIVHGMPIAYLLSVLATQPELGGREIIDQTGLKEKYDFTLQWEPAEQETPMFNQDDNNIPRSDGASSVDSSAPSLFTAIREQLGLKLESTKAPVEVIVIDHVDRPSEN